MRSKIRLILAYVGKTRVEKSGVERMQCARALTWPGDSYGEWQGTKYMATFLSVNYG